MNAFRPLPHTFKLTPDLRPPAILISLLPDEETKRRPTNAFDSPDDTPWRELERMYPGRFDSRPWGVRRSLDRRFIGGNP